MFSRVFITAATVPFLVRAEYAMYQAASAIQTPPVNARSTPVPSSTALANLATTTAAAPIAAASNCACAASAAAPAAVSTVTVTQTVTVSPSIQTDSSSPATGSYSSADSSLPTGYGYEVASSTVLAAMATGTMPAISGADVKTGSSLALLAFAFFAL